MSYKVSDVVELTSDYSVINNEMVVGKQGVIEDDIMQITPVGRYLLVKFVLKNGLIKRFLIEENNMKVVTSASGVWVKLDPAAMSVDDRVRIICDRDLSIPKHSEGIISSLKPHQNRLNTVQVIFDIDKSRELFCYVQDLEINTLLALPADPVNTPSEPEEKLSNEELWAITRSFCR